MDFKKKMNQRLTIAVVYIAVGIVLAVWAVLSKMENYFPSAFGFALIVLGILRMIQYWKITGSQDTMHKRELAETDERNRMIAEKARSWAFSFSMLVAGLAVIVLSLLNCPDLAQPLAWFVCLMTVLYWVFYLVARRKY